MGMNRIDPPIPMDTPKGKGWAHFVIDYGLETHLYWVIFINDTGECWTFPNPAVRAEKNFTMQRYGNHDHSEMKKQWFIPADDPKKDKSE